MTGHGTGSQSTADSPGKKPPVDGHPPIKLKLKNPFFKRKTATATSNANDELPRPPLTNLIVPPEVANMIALYVLADTSDHQDIKLDGTGKVDGSGIQYKSHFRLIHLNKAWRHTFKAVFMAYIPKNLCTVSADMSLLPPNISTVGRQIKAMPAIFHEFSENSRAFVVLYELHEMSVYSVTELALELVEKQDMMTQNRTISVMIAPEETTPAGETMTLQNEKDLTAFICRCLGLASRQHRRTNGHVDADDLERMVFELAFFDIEAAPGEDHQWVCDEWFMAHAGGKRKISFSKYKANERARLRRRALW